jgi:Rrf2 family protein
MDLNTRGRYAVMAMADLARHGGAAPVPLPQIAERQQLSVAYLEQIFIRLRRARLVDSERGRSGGYRLGRSPGAISIAEIMDAVEEDTRMTRCMGPDAAGCLGAGKCQTHNLWHALGCRIRGFLANVTLGEVLSGASPDELQAKAGTHLGARA